MKPSDQEIQDLYVNQKFTLEQISKKFGVSKTYIFRKVKKLGLKPNDHKSISPPSKEDLISLYEIKKNNTIEIAKIYNVSRVTVGKWLRNYNIKTRKIFDPIPVPPKKELQSLFIDMKKTMSDIAKIYGVDRNLVSKWLSSEGVALYVPSKDLLEDLYIKNKLTLKQIGSIYDVSRMTVARWFNTYGIQIISNQRKYYHLKAIPLTSKQKEFVIGTMLGDGYLHRNKRKSSARLTMTHGEKQLKYLLWKKDIMNNFVNTVRRGKEQINRGNSVCWSWASIHHNELNFYHSLFYENNKKVIRENIAHYLTPLSMAVWFMDDGWKNHLNLRISSESFTEKENQILVDAIKLNFDINAKVVEYSRNNKKYYYISFNKRNSLLLTDLIKPYVIESMKYKLLDISDVDRSSTTTC